MWPFDVALVRFRGDGHVAIYRDGQATNLATHPVATHHMAIIVESAGHYDRSISRAKREDVVKRLGQRFADGERRQGQSDSLAPQHQQPSSNQRSVGNHHHAMPFQLSLEFNDRIRPK